MTFEQALINQLTHIRKQFADRDFNHMDITIEASGPVHGDLKISFKVDSDYTTHSVRGNSLEAALEEFFRQRKWYARHEPLALPYTTQVALANTD